jgi:hypothetical protein
MKNKDVRLPIPAKLQCPECPFGDDDPERFAAHLMQIHGQTEKAAWFAAGQEYERLYPRFRAPVGMCSVLGMDLGHKTGKVIGDCTSLAEAVKIADQLAGAYYEVSIVDEKGQVIHKGLTMNGLPQSRPAPTTPTMTRESVTPKPLESYTKEEQEILLFVAKHDGRDYAEKFANLILDQARAIGDL